jgi:RNA polymerase sigma-70 factor (ECF subfamily)
MGPAPATRPSLLVRLRDPRDDQAWSQFVEVYAPLVYGYARKHGLQDADAADLTQDVLRAVARAADDLVYDPRRGSFRGWLFTVARNKLHNFLTRQRRHPRGTGDSGVKELLEAQPAPEDEAQWDQEYEQRLFSWAAEEVRGAFQETTWRAFWQTAVEGKGPAEVAAALGMSVGAVYIAKSRVLARLKEQIRLLQEE